MTQLVENSREQRYPVDMTGDEVRFFSTLTEQVGKLPESAERVEYWFGEDSDGGPAVWITIVAREDINPSRETIEEFGRTSDALRDAVLNSGFRRWPYVRIKTE